MTGKQRRTVKSSSSKAGQSGKEIHREMCKCLERVEEWRVENLIAPNGTDRFAQEEKQNITVEYRNVLEINKNIHREMRKFLERLEVLRVENLMAPNRMDRFVQEEREEH